MSGDAGRYLKVGIIVLMDLFVAKDIFHLFSQEKVEPKVPADSMRISS